MSEELSSNVNNTGLPPSEHIKKWPRQAMKDGKWGEAIDRWAVLRAVYPDLGEAWVEAAISHQRLGQLDKAEILLTDAFKCFEGMPILWLEFAMLRCVQRRFSEAEGIAQEALIRFPDDKEVLLEVAKVFSLCGDVEAALNINAQARKAFSDDAMPWIQYAEFAMDDESWPVALERWQYVRKHFPKNSEGYTRAAFAADALGKERLARQLRLACEYGNAWFESLQNDSHDAETLHAVKPPQRRSFHTFIDLVWTKARLNLKSEASQNHLRYLWWVLDPFLYMTVFYLVFGLLMERGGPGFIAYLLTGLVPFQWFAKTIQHTSNSIVGGKGLMHKVKISPLFFPLVGIVQNTGKQLLVFSMLGIFLILYGLPPTVHWLAFIPIVIVQLMLMTAVSCILAMIVPFVRDLTNLIPTGIQFLLFSSGIFYTIDRIPEEWRSLFFANPIANILYQYRLVLVENQWPDWEGLGWVAFGCVVGLCLVVLLYWRFESIFPRVVIE